MRILNTYGVAKPPSRVISPARTTTESAPVTLIAVAVGPGWRARRGRSSLRAPRPQHLGRPDRAPSVRHGGWRLRMARPYRSVLGWGHGRDRRRPHLLIGRSPTPGRRYACARAPTACCEIGALPADAPDFSMQRTIELEIAWSLNRAWGRVPQRGHDVEEHRHRGGSRIQRSRQKHVRRHDARCDLMSVAPVSTAP